VFVKMKVYSVGYAIVIHNDTRSTEYQILITHSHGLVLLDVTCLSCKVANTWSHIQSYATVMHLEFHVMSIGGLPESVK
jgi:hypothetical protein